MPGVGGTLLELELWVRALESLDGRVLVPTYVTYQLHLARCTGNLRRLDFLSVNPQVLFTKLRRKTKSFDVFLLCSNDPFAKFMLSSPLLLSIGKSIRLVPFLPIALKFKTL